MNAVDGLEELTAIFFPDAKDMEPLELALGMEFVLESLHQSSMLSRDEVGPVKTYSDMLDKMFSNISHSDDED